MAGLLRGRSLLLPLAAIRARRAHAAMSFLSYTVAFGLFGFAASMNATLGHLTPDRTARIRLDTGTAVIVLIGLATILVLNGSALALSVRSHIKELAVLKAVGFPSHRIVAFVFLEAALPASLGALVGLALSQPLALWTLHRFPGGASVKLSTMSAGAAALAALAVISLLVMSVLIPAHRVLRLDVVATLSR